MAYLFLFTKDQVEENINFAFKLKQSLFLSIILSERPQNSKIENFDWYKKILLLIFFSFKQFFEIHIYNQKQKLTKLRLLEKYVR